MLCSGKLASLGVVQCCLQGCTACLSSYMPHFYRYVACQSYQHRLRCLARLTFLDPAPGQQQRQRLVDCQHAPGSVHTCCAGLSAQGTVHMSTLHGRQVAGTRLLEHSSVMPHLSDFSRSCAWTAAAAAPRRSPACSRQRAHMLCRSLSSGHGTHEYLAQLPSSGTKTVGTFKCHASPV